MDQADAGEREDAVHQRVPASGHNADRRRFLWSALSATTAPLLAFAPPAVARPHATASVCVALGSGGARGLAHLLMLEVLDELDIRPRRIAGSSIGAVIGVLYAAGLSAAEIRSIIDSLTVSGEESWFDAVFSEEVYRWAGFVEPTSDRGGLLETRAFIDFLRKKTRCDSFADLKIPLQIVASDYWHREQVIFDSGELWPAVAASMALPGLFVPVEHQGRVLVDGGLVNPVPYDIFPDTCDITVAVDVLGSRTPEDSEIPSYTASGFNAFQILQASIIRAKVNHRPPDILLQPDIRDVKVLEFYRFEQIYSQARPERDRLRQELAQRLGATGER